MLCKTHPTFPEEQHNTTTQHKKTSQHNVNFHNTTTFSTTQQKLSQLPLCCGLWENCCVVENSCCVVKVLYCVAINLCCVVRFLCSVLCCGKCCCVVKNSCCVVRFSVWRRGRFMPPYVQRFNDVLLHNGLCRAMLCIAQPMPLYGVPLSFLPPTKEEVHAFVCLSVSKITQKCVHRFQ